MDEQLKPGVLQTESDVEQKFIAPLLTGTPPRGLGYNVAELFTKPNVRDFEIEKGGTSKRYFPDYVVCLAGIPVMIVEAKRPGENLLTAAREARLYAGELNAVYPAQINPCRYCLVSDGLTTQLRAWDSDKILSQFPLQEAVAIAPSFGTFINIVGAESLRAVAERILRDLRPPRYFRPLSLLGGQTTQNEQIASNDFGRVLAANFQSIFDPGSYGDRQKIALHAYVGSPRKLRYAGEIDRIIRNAVPSVSADAQLIEDTENPRELTVHFADLASLRNKILLLVGSVGSGKSTFVDYLRESVLAVDFRDRITWVRIDLNPAPLTSSEIYSWLRRRIIDDLKASAPEIDTDSLPVQLKMYRKQIEPLEKIDGELLGKESQEYRLKLASRLGELRDDHQATIHCLEQYLCTGRGRLLIIALDNCDKRNRDEQLLMFQVAKYIQNEIRCLVILPLRHETFDNHRNEPPLDTALKDHVFRIEPPSFQEVLKKRLGLVIKEARQIGPKKLSYHAGEKAIELPVAKLERYLHAMMGALFDHKQYGRKIIVGLAGWNIRKAFEIFLEFARSGYIRDEDIFKLQVSRDQNPNLSQGVVGKVLFRTNRRYYDGDNSYVKNLFQLDPAAPAPLQFLRYWILAWLRSKAPERGPSGIKGFHRQGDLELCDSNAAISQKPDAFFPST